MFTVVFFFFRSLNLLRELLLKPVSWKVLAIGSYAFCYGGTNSGYFATSTILVSAFNLGGEVILGYSIGSDATGIYVGLDSYYWIEGI